MSSDPVLTLTIAEGELASAVIDSKIAVKYVDELILFYMKKYPTLPYKNLICLKNDTQHNCLNKKQKQITDFLKVLVNSRNTLLWLDIVRGTEEA